MNANREAMSVTHGDGTDTLPGHMSSPPVFSGVRVTKSLVFCVVVCKLLFVCWSLSLSVLQFTVLPLCYIRTCIVIKSDLKSLVSTKPDIRPT